MAQAVHETTYDVDADQLLAAVMDYESYPEFVDGMKKVTVDRSGGKVTVHYDLSMMGKDMSYTLTLLEEPEKGHLSWSLLKSEFFKINNGDWLVESLGQGKCKARYFSEVDFTFPVPGFVLKPMVKGAVPKMMDGFYQRAKSHPKNFKAEPVQSKEPVNSKESEQLKDPVSTDSAHQFKAESVTPQMDALKMESVSQKKVESVVESINDSAAASSSESESEFESKHRWKKMNDHSHGDSGILSWAKKIMTVGVGTFFLTEESLKTMISEFKLPKEMMAGLLDGAKNVRQEFMQSVVQEVMSKVSDKMDPAAVMAEFLKKNEVTFEIKIKVKEKTDV
jgi:ribosome-associated toxin RatA of RatAB toxin-antitoxin module